MNELNFWLLDFISTHYPAKSRYEIDLYLIKAGYSPSEIEQAWENFFNPPLPLPLATSIFSLKKVRLGLWLVNLAASLVGLVSYLLYWQGDYGSPVKGFDWNFTLNSDAKYCLFGLAGLLVLDLAGFFLVVVGKPAWSGHLLIALVAAGLFVTAESTYWVGRHDESLGQTLVSTSLWLIFVTNGWSFSDYGRGWSGWFKSLGYYLGLPLLIWFLFIVSLML